MNTLLGGKTDFFGLDIGTTAIRLVELQGVGQPKQLLKYAFVPLDAKLALSESKQDQQKLSQTIAELVAHVRPSSKNVAVGLPSSRVFTTVADVDRLSPDEMAKAIRFQADALIPTPLAESKIDWALLGDSPADKTKQEILLSSVPNSFAEARLDMLEAIGLNVVAFEADNMALARSLTAPDSTEAELILDIGRKSTDLVIMFRGAPRLIRSIPTGVEAIIKSASQGLNTDETQAEQFVMKFGLSKDKLEGQILQAVTGTIELLATEIEKSIKFFQTRYVGTTVTKMIVTGGASVIPEFPLYLADKFSINIEVGNVWRNVSYSREKQNELMALSSQFAVAVGLAERNT